MNNLISSEKLFDLSILEAMDDDEYTRDMINTYISDTPAELKKMHSSLQQSSPAELAKLAHKLKSSTAVFQSDKLVGMFETIERLSKSAYEPNNLRTIFEEINEQYKALESALKIQLRQLAK